MSLNAIKRKEFILDKLSANGKIKNAELVRELNVSSETIRRYLEELEQENRLKKVWGGAVKVAYEIPEPDYLSRVNIQAKEKEVIGKVASELINDNETIAVDEGSTNLELIRHIRNKRNLTIITSSFPLVSELIKLEQAKHFQGKIIFIGGHIDTQNLRTCGVFAIEMMNNFIVDKAFISAIGVMKNRGATGFDSGKTMLSKKYIERAKVSVIMCDHSKIGVQDYYQIADFKDIDIIISDVAAPNDWSEYLEQVETRWIIAK